MNLTHGNNIYSDRITKILYSFVGLIIISLLINYIYISSKVIEPSNEIIRNEYTSIYKKQLQNEVNFVLRILESIKKENNISSDEIPEHLINYATSILKNYNKNSSKYIFALDENWNIIIHEDIESIKRHNNDFNNIISIIKNTIESGENWVVYDNKPIHSLDMDNENIKQSYVIYLPEWKMTIGSGYLNKSIKVKTNKFIQKINGLINQNKSNLLILNITLILLSIFIATTTNLWIELQIEKNDSIIKNEKNKINSTLKSLDNYISRDPVTNLLNKRALTSCIRKLKCLKDNSQYQIHVFEIDYSSQRNFNAGYNCRVSMLKEFSSCLRKINLESHKLFHIDYDHFVFLTKAMTNDDFNKFTNKIRNELNHIILCGNSTKILFRCSTIDVNIYFDSIENVLDKSEYALKIARQGKLNHVYYNEEIDAIRDRELGLSVELMTAIQKSELKVHYQPQFCSSTNRISGVEAFVRWNNSKYGNVFPNEFITLAEEKGILSNIGTYVIGTALRDLKKLKNVTMTINILPSELLQVNFAKFIKDLIEEHQIEPDKVIFDIAKQIDLNDIEAISFVMHELRKLGVKFSISSVGIGQSSLKYICELPVGEIKIPLEIINKIDKNKNYLSFTKSAINFANETGLNIVLEGVETGGNLKSISKLPNSSIQGFNLSVAKPIELIINEIDIINEVLSNV
ncbi:EAL domain-containing protein [Vibrio diazotrophicus]|uniref:EAL domain-containing protein n=1 Tax=Vibrio diazotrophicus TaxID=685 RepID=UPI00142E0A7C|nr:EAL domain-containing protein [Vibrio diazotrophicus]NIY92751.1 EAL domain-containing protein [Vibrio diazotrophicus]